MKFMRSSVLLATAVAVSAIAVAQGEIRPGIATAGIVDTYDEAFAPTYSSRFRHLQAGSLPSDPTTSPPTPTTPTPTTPTPTTPEPTTPGPTTDTPEPSTDTPEPTTATPEPTTPGETPTETPEPDTSIEAPDTGSDSSSQESSGNGGSTDKASSSSKADTGAKDADSGSNTITIVAIVGGIVVGVALLAFVAFTCARRRRDDDDDPLSPFELSMDKGYNGAPTYNNQNQHNNNANNSALAYSGVRTATNNSGAVAFGGGVGAGAAAGGYAASQQPYNNNTAAGVNYKTQFYDVTSPGSAYHQQEMFKKQSSEEIQANDTSLWMSAMEPKDHDAEGASVPPEVSILGDNASFMSAGSRNSYDAVSEEIDIDQSSVFSGGSDLEKEFPDYEDESSRGSYEL